MKPLNPLKLWCDFLIERTVSHMTPVQWSKPENYPTDLILLSIHSDFISSPNNIFYGKIKVMHFIQSSSSVYLNLEEFLSPSLCFKTLASLKSTGQLLRSFLQFGFIWHLWLYDLNCSVLLCYKTNMRIALLEFRWGIRELIHVKCSGLTEPGSPESTIRKWKRERKRERERHGDPSSDGARVLY